MLPVFISVIETPEDRDVIIEFFQQHKKLLYAEAYKYLSTKEDVEDTVYETIARIIDKMETFRSLAPLQRIQYAKVTVRNLSYMIQKKRSRINMVPFEDVDAYLAIDESELPDSIVLQKIQLQQMRTIWAAMPAEERLLLEQKYILRWSDEELAHRLDIQPQSVRMRLTRAKRRVIELMKEKGFLISEWLEK